MTDDVDNSFKTKFKLGLISFLKGMGVAFSCRAIAILMSSMCIFNALIFIEYMCIAFGLVEVDYPLSKKNIVLSCINTLFLFYWWPKATKRKLTRKEEWQRKLEGGSNGTADSGGEA